MEDVFPFLPLNFDNMCFMWVNMIDIMVEHSTSVPEPMVLITNAYRITLLL